MISQRPNESTADYLKRLFAEGDAAVNGLNKTLENLKKDGVVKFCKDCGGTIYKDKKHKCI